MPGTKLEPQWCPTGLTHAQKRRVQRLRASEIREEENRNMDGMIPDGISKNTSDTPTDLDIDKSG
jgi:hypothetical protein